MEYRGSFLDIFRGNQLNIGLNEKGYRWNTDEGMPVLKNDANTQISPVAKAHKRILNGPEDSVTFFSTVAFSIANGEFTPPEQEVISLELVHTVTRKYYENIDEDNFLKEIPYVDTTENMKRSMGLIK